MPEWTAIITITFGWLLGLLTPGIAERIRRPYRRRDLMQAVVDEMLTLQYTMALLAHEIRARSAEVSDAFLDELLPIVDGYIGPEGVDGMAGLIRQEHSLSEEQRAAAHQLIHNPNVNISIRQYSIPLFATQIGDLAICKLDFQRSVLHIRYHLDLFNQLAAYAQSLFEKTFDKPSPQDLKALITNHKHAIIDVGKQAEIIIRAIGDLQKRYGSKQKSTDPS